MKQEKQIDMVGGNLWRNIFRYSLPLMFSNVLQVVFNISDIAVVGTFSGESALGSVGSTTILVTLLTGILLGMGGGVNAEVALWVGAEDDRRVSNTVHTSFLLCLLTGLLLLAAGLLSVRGILVCMHTKEELLGGAVTYLRIYLLGSPALALYNFGNGILSAIGDTRRPLIYLSIAGVVNVALNLLFVIVFQLSVAGVALASVISQYLSAVLVLRSLCRSKGAYALRLKDIRLHPTAVRRVLRIGIPSALQYVMFAVANLFIQAAVNYFQPVVVEGNSAAANADTLTYDVMAAFYTACTSFIAQNYGAGNRRRIMQTYGITLLYALAAGAFLGGAFFLLHRPFLHLFAQSEEVIGYGVIRLKIMACSYWISAFMDNATAAARGLGKTVVPTIIVVMGTVVFRIIWIYTVFAYFHTLDSLYLLYACAWILTAAAGNFYFFRQYRKLPENIHVPAV